MLTEQRWMIHAKNCIMRYRTLMSFHLIFLMAFIPSCHGQLPLPSGCYNIGVCSSQLNDPSRQDLINSDAPRHIPVSVYYPTFDALKLPSFYMTNKRLLSEMITFGYSHQDSLALSKMATYKVQAIPHAEIIKDQNFPLILFSHGLGVSRLHYRLLFEEWASQGYIVVAIDHPYGGFTMFSDGQLATSRMDPLLVAQDRAYLLKTIDLWVEDISFVISQITSNGSPLGTYFSSLINIENIVSIGHSLGGNVAVLASHNDQRIKAAINMDGGTFNDKLHNAYKKPILTLRSQPIYSDDDLLKKGRNRSDWDRMGQDIDASFAAELSQAKLAYELKISGAGHMSFSDAPFVLPDMVTRFGGKVIDAHRGFDLIKESIHLFLDSIRSNRPAPLGQLVDRYPELSLKIYGGGGISDTTSNKY